MAPLSLRIITEGGSVTRTLLFDGTMNVREAQAHIVEKLNAVGDHKDHGLFLMSADNDKSGIWLEQFRQLDYYMLRDGDSLHFQSRTRNLRLRLLDDSVKTLQVNEAKTVGDLMQHICSRLRIANHDEYGLCHEPLEQAEEKERPITGTLTLRRVKQEKAKDAKMTQLSKKLKTDDNVEWLDPHKTLRELGVDPATTLLFKRRLFFSDRNIDSRDPVQLNLLYLQTRDAILEGRHPVTEAQALEFAAIQCQIHYGDFQEDKHKPGLIENLNEYLPSQYCSKSAEKKIFKLHRNHSGLNSLEAKHLYNKTARDLPTYGVTFFVVKEKQKDKKKLVPRLLGVNSGSILRLDENTKEVLQVWPLTQVQSYHATKNDTFTLNFGDYSDKEYAVKTNDAYRIRDIIEDYIDIIRKRMLAAGSSHHQEHGVVCQEEVFSNRGNVMTMVQNNPYKVVEQSFVGPSQMVDYQPGQSASSGTKVMTVQQMVITNMGSKQQQASSGAVPLRPDMSLRCVKQLNNVNAHAVQFVSLLSEPSNATLEEAKKIVDAIEARMEDISEGVTATAGKQSSDEARRRLLAELEELRKAVEALKNATRDGEFNAEEAEEQAKRIADLSTQIYFAIDPAVRRRSDALRRSRKSFIQDERTESALRRASVLAASRCIGEAADKAAGILTQEYSGPALSDAAARKLESESVDGVGRLNAAVALYLSAFADPKNIDYSTAANSLNTIKELLPELAKASQALGSTRDPESRQELLERMREAAEAAKAVCDLTGVDDHDKIQDKALAYADVSGKLIYTFGRNGRGLDPDREDNIIELAKRVGDAMTQLLLKANELTGAAEAAEPEGAERLDSAGVDCVGAARDLLAVAKLTAPSIAQKHCQSALSAAAENLSSSAQQLAVAWKPLVEGRQEFGEDLKTGTMDLAKALDRLLKSYADLDEDNMAAEEPPSPERLRFIQSAAAARERAAQAEKKLDQPQSSPPPSPQRAAEMERGLAPRIAQINAAVAAAMLAMADPQNQDLVASEQAMATISELLPEVMEDTCVLSSTCTDPNARAASLADVRAWAAAVRGVCDGLENGPDMEEAGRTFAACSQKLSFVFSPRANRAREQLLLELSSLAEERARLLTSETRALAATAGSKGAALGAASDAVDDNARALRSSVQITAPTIHAPRCQSVLLSSVDSLSSSAQGLVSAATQLRDDETGCQVLAEKQQKQQQEIRMHGEVLERHLDGIRETCAGVADLESTREKFAKSSAGVQDQISAAEDLLNLPAEPSQLSPAQQDEARARLASEAPRLRAAAAILVAATADTDPDDKNYKTAEEAIATISAALPIIVKDTVSLAGCQPPTERDTALQSLRDWCQALRALTAAAAQDGDKPAVEKSSQAIADADNKLVFMFGKRDRPAKEQQVQQLTGAACSRAQRMCSDGRAAASALGGPPGARLAYAAAGVEAASAALYAAAQLTAPSINNPHCQAALLTSAEGLSSSAKELVGTAGRMRDPCSQRLAEELMRSQDGLERAVQGIKEICGKGGKPVAKPKPPVPMRKVGDHGSIRPVRVVSPEVAICQEFLHQLRAEESQGDALPPPPPPPTFADTKVQKKVQEGVLAKKAHEAQQKKAEEVEKRRVAEEMQRQAAEETKRKAAEALMRQAEEDKKRAEEERILAIKMAEEKRRKDQLAHSVKEAETRLKAAEQELQKVSSTPSPLPPLDESRLKAVQEQLESRLARAAAASASLLAAQQGETVDYAAASEAVRNVSTLMPQIIKDAALLSNHGSERSRKSLLDAIRALTQATRNLCAAGDRQSAQAAGAALSERTARLLYVVSTTADPQQETEVLSRAKAIADRAAALTLAGTELGGATAVCSAGVGAAAAAAGLVYTAKIVAPMIHHEDCKNTLIVSANDLTSNLKAFSHSWKPLASEPQYSTKVAELTADAKVLEKLLEEFKLDLAAGKLVRKLEPAENTEIRKLTTKIMEHAQDMAESPANDEETKKVYAQYARRLADAIRALDAANVKRKRAPNSPEAGRGVESAVQALHLAVLQHSPGRSAKGNVVDIADFVNAVSAEAEKLREVSSNAQAVHNQKELEAIKQECDRMVERAYQVQQPLPEDAHELDTIRATQHFAEDCAKRVSAIDAMLSAIPSGNERKALSQQTAALAESCHLLRFTTNSALSTAQCAALDEAAEDLESLRKRLDQLLQAPAGDQPAVKSIPPSFYKTRALACSAAGGAPRGAALAPAAVAYAVAAAGAVDTGDEGQRRHLKDHLTRVLAEMSALVGTLNTRVLTWQPLDGPEVVDATTRVLKELESPILVNGADKALGVLDAGELNALLLPLEPTEVKGDMKQLQHSLSQCANKLSSLTGTVVASAAKRESLQRSAKTVANAANQLAANGVALARISEDPVQSNRVEEAAQEMRFATYNTLRAAERLCQDPDNANLRRRLLDACRLLTDAINNLCVNSAGPRSARAAAAALARVTGPARAHDGTAPLSALPYAQCVDTVQRQQEVVACLHNESSIPRDQFVQSLRDVVTAACAGAEYGADCGYLVSISESHPDLARQGVPSASRAASAADALRDSCCRVLQHPHPDNAKDEESKIKQQVDDLKMAVKEVAASKGDVKKEITEAVLKLDVAGNAFADAVRKESSADITPTALSLSKAAGALSAIMARPELAPPPSAAPQAAMRDEIVDRCRTLLTKTETLAKEVGAAEDQDTMTWVTFNSRKGVLEAFEALLDSIRTNGQRAGLVLKLDVEEEEESKKSYLQTQVEIAEKWLKKRNSTPEVAAEGQRAVREIIDVALLVNEGAHGQEKEDASILISESEQLLVDCALKYQQDKANGLSERLRELRRLSERAAVARVVEDFLAEPPMQDLDVLADAETDEVKRKFLLERKIAELLAQLGRVQRTARLTAATSGASGTGSEVQRCVEQAELLAPKLVQAATQRVSRPNDAAAAEHYRSLLAGYTRALDAIRDQCDKAVDPLDFVQTAGEAMQRLRDDAPAQPDPQHGAKMSFAIQSLARRVIEVGLSSSEAGNDPALRGELTAARKRLTDAPPRASRVPDWKAVTADILRTTCEVESVLGGENIFKKEPEPDQPIYNAAFGLHAAVRGWSARDNDLVAVAKKVAVHTARLSHYMSTGQAREVLSSSRGIVAESREVARLARALANECTDQRIKQNLLQVCERIPTISGQLKMLISVKATNLQGQMNTANESEAMDTLVSNAQNLMLSVQEVVKAAGGACVQIASRRGPRVRWVPRRYY